MKFQTGPAVDRKLNSVGTIETLTKGGYDTEGVTRMTSFSVKTRLKPDGTLQVAIPTGLPEADVDVLVVIRPLDAGSRKVTPTGSWPEGFLDKTYGCLAEDPLVREPQLQYEAREKLL
jgi:hypothetical protein